MSAADPPYPRSRRLPADAALFVGVGLLLALLGPYDTDQLPTVRRFVYWVACIVGGGACGVAVDEALGPRLRGALARILVPSVLMTPPTMAVVIAAGVLLAAQRYDSGRTLNLVWQVFVISAAIMAVRFLVRRAPRTVVETRTVTAPPSPEAESAFRRRLSARRRNARLIAVEAHDHYLRVHTDAGVELLTLRFADALGELAPAHGHRIHRSWWVAADALESVRFRRGSGEARLAGGVVAPVSRTYAPALREAGWL